MNHEHYMATNTFKPGKPRSECRNCYHKRREHYGPHEFCPAIVITPVELSAKNRKPGTPR